MIRIAWLLGTTLALVGMSVGTAWAGSEDSPDLSDPAGNVAYHELYRGDHDHDYLDLTSAWWTYDPLADTIAFALQGVDFSSLDGGVGSDVKVMCWLAFSVEREGAEPEYLRFGWEQEKYDEPTFRSVATTGGQDVEHAFSAVLEAPGTLTWTVEREVLAEFGESLSKPTTRCIEEFFPVVDPSQSIADRRVFGSSPTYNGNPTIRGDDVIDLSRPAAPPEGGQVAAAEAAAEPAVEPEPASKAAPTPGLGTVLVAVSLIALAAFARRRWA